MEVDSRSWNVEQPVTDLHKEDCVVHHFYRESLLPKTNVATVTHGHNCPNYVHALLAQDLQEEEWGILEE